MYIATRGLYGLKPPTVFVPPSIKEDVEKLLDVHRSMSQVELNLDLIALDVGKYSVFFTHISSPFCFPISMCKMLLETLHSGETYEMRNDLVVRPVRTHHVIPSQVCLQISSFYFRI